MERVEITRLVKREKPMAMEDFWNELSKMDGLTEPMVRVVNREIEKGKARKEKQEQRKALKELEQEPMLQEILAVLREFGDLMTATMVANSIGRSVQKTTPMLLRLVERKEVCKVQAQMTGKGIVTAYELAPQD